MSNRYAIRMPDGTLRAVPPMVDGLPSSVRVKVFEYVLRNQLGLAEMTAQIEAEVIEGRERHDARVAAALNGRTVYLSDDYGTGVAA